MESHFYAEFCCGLQDNAVVANGLACTGEYVADIAIQ